MFDSSKVNVKDMRTDLIKNAVVVLVSRVLKFYVLENASGKGDAQLFNQDFVYSLVFLLLGFVAFHVVVQPAIGA
jgi:hypothetical protein